MLDWLPPPHEEEAELCLRSFEAFARRAWAVVEEDTHEHTGPGGIPLAASPPAPATFDFSALSAEEYQRYQELAAKARVAFETMTPAEVAELQGLLRKVRAERASEESDDAERR